VRDVLGPRVMVETLSPPVLGKENARRLAALG
jgi:hypothetical protein